MSFKQAGFKNVWQMNQLLILVISLLLALFLIPQPGNTKENKTSSNNRLPPAPDTGSPEEDFSAGGTRDNRPRKGLCGVNKQQVAYLLGDRNREFTSSAHPTFWFHIPKTMNKIAKVTLVVSELETGEKKYGYTVAGNQLSQITGIDLPKEQQYALSPEVNYAWSLEVDCTAQNKKSEVILDGWITRLPSKARLSEQLAATPEAEKHTVYLEHNLLYDALTQLAQRRIAKPNNIQVQMAWNNLLAELGWQDLIETRSAIKPSLLDIQVCSSSKKRALSQ